MSELEPWLEGFSEPELEQVARFVDRHWFRRGDRLNEASRAIKNRSKNAGQTVLVAEKLLTVAHLLFSTPEKHKTLRALHGLLDRLNTEDFALMLDLSQTLVTSSAGRELRERLRDFTLKESEMEGAIQYVLSSGGSDQGSFLESWLKFVASGEWFLFADEMLGANEEEMRQRIPPVGALFEFLFDNKSKLFNELTSFFSFTDAPVSCLGGAQTVESGAKLAVQEIRSHAPGEFARHFFERDLPLYLISFNTFCNLNSAYPQYWELANAFIRENKLDLAVKLVKTLDEQRAVEVVDWLASGHERISPTMAKLNEHYVWKDVLLLLQLPRIQDRGQIERLARMILDQDIPSVLQKNVLALTPRIRRELITQALSLDQNTLSAVRGILLSERNRVWRAWAKELLDDEDEMLELLEIGYRAMQRPNWVQARDWFQSATKSGLIEHVANSLATLLAAGGSLGIATPAVEEPRRFVSRAMHDLSGDDLLDFTPEPANVRSDGPCRQIDLNYRMDDVESSLLGLRFFDFIDCNLLDGSTRPPFSEEQIRSARPVFNQHADFFAALKQKLGVEGSSQLASRFFGTAGDGRLYRFFDGIAHWIGEDESSSTLMPLMDLAQPILDHAEPLDKAQRLLVRIWGSPQLKTIVSPWFQSDRKSKPVTDTGVAEIDPVQIAGEARAIECASPRLDPSERAVELINDFKLAPANDQFQDGRRQRSWSTDELQSRLIPILQLADSVGFRNAILILLKQLDTEAVARWFVDKARKIAVIPYYDPSDDEPRARVVNSLDQFELLLLNGDMRSWDGRNQAIKYLEMIAEAWGDLPRESWPEVIREKFPSSSKTRPRTIGEAREAIRKDLAFFKKWLGFPKFPKCFVEEFSQWEGGTVVGRIVPRGFRARNFNVHSVFEAVTEEDLRMLRDLVFPFYKMTPERFRGGWHKRQNLVYAWVGFARVGALRQLGRWLVRGKTSDATMSGLLEAINNDDLVKTGFAMTSRLVKKLGEDQKFSQNFVGHLSGVFGLAALERLVVDTSDEQRRAAVDLAVTLLAHPDEIMGALELYCGVAADPRVLRAMDEFRKRHARLMLERAYTDLDLAQVWFDVGKFFFTAENQATRDAADAFRATMAQELDREFRDRAGRQGPAYLEAILGWIAENQNRDADNFYQFLDKVRMMITSGRIQNFFDHGSRQLVGQP